MTDWKKKLAAYLHDPPSKCLDVATHGERSSAAFNRAGVFSPDEIQSYVKQADWTAASADRIPFPRSQSSATRCKFDGRYNTFRHPLKGDCRLPFLGGDADGRPLDVCVAEEVEQKLQPAPDTSELPAGDRHRAAFFATWRLWPQRCSEEDWRMAFLPADTRLPDHTIWTHMSLVSALAGCAESDDSEAVLNPALLKFQLGPVQDFIAAARNTRDLWSGSYLLSWLMAAGLKALALETGPDAVISPNLRGQPLFDLHLRDDLWQKVREHENAKPAWDSLNHPTEALLTPNLPHVFLAVVPAPNAEKLARRVQEAISAEWEAIAKSVWDERETLRIDEVREPRFFQQVGDFLQPTWQITPWPQSTGEMLRLAEKLPKADSDEPDAIQRVRKIIEVFTSTTPVEDRDRRFYTDESRTDLNNAGLTWPLAVALASWELDATRQLRAFEGWAVGGWANGVGARASDLNAKDSLTGREELIVGGEEWRKTLREPWSTLFKHADDLGAPSLIKRVWHRTYLCKAPWDFRPDDFKMPSVLSIARGKPDEDSADEDLEGTPESTAAKYFAVLAFDGDSIGKWVAGDQCPAFGTQLADYQDDKGRAGVAQYFENRAPDLLALRRPLSPSYHLMFSEALSNFAGRCAGRIVQHFGGRLIYAGGDDVVALLPATKVIACAEALDRAFRGLAPNENFGIGHRADGFLSEKESDGSEAVFVVPGPAATGSVGIAIAHVKAPLQDVVRAAVAAEKRAKKVVRAAVAAEKRAKKVVPDKHAVGVTAFKRSGETTKWTCRFESETDNSSASDSMHRGGLPALTAIQRALDAEHLSGKFPHRVIELLAPYVSTGSRCDTAEFDATAARSILEREIDFALGRQTKSAARERIRVGDPATTHDIDQVRKTILVYADNIFAANPAEPTGTFRALIDLLTIAAFLARQPESEK